MDPNRRAFLRGSFLRELGKRRSTGLLPPWAVEAFAARCSQCDACIEACPEQILRHDAEGYPQLDLRERGCTFCGACVDACEPGALDRLRGREHRYRARIAPSCLAVRDVTCRLCELACEPDAISFVPRPGRAAMPRVDGSRCTGCGACLAVCPAEAIRLVDQSG